MEAPLLVVLLVPLAAALGAALLSYRHTRDMLTVLLGGVLVWQVGYLFFAWQHIPTDPPSLTLLFWLPGLSLAFSVDALGLIFALVSSILWVVTHLYASGYMHHNKEQHQKRFFTCFALAIFAAQGMAFADNLLTLFLFYEVMTLVTFPLVAHQGTVDARKSAVTYLGWLLGGSLLFFLPALIWIYTRTGTLDFWAGGVIAGHFSALETGILLALLLYGIGKAALVPMHRWLPAAMVAPTPVSALLHAVAVVKAGVFTVLKVISGTVGIAHLHESVLQDFWAGGWWVYLAAFSVLWASWKALKQDNLKRLLAYSTVSQLAYISLAASLLTPLSLLAAAFHIAGHALAKITLFFTAGAIYTASGKKAIGELNGIGRMMPWTMGAFAIAALSMIGLPPTVGFLSKYYMMLGAMEAVPERGGVVIVTLVLSTLLNAAYFLPILWRAFFLAPAKTEKAHGEAPALLLVPLCITAASVIGCFFLPDLWVFLATVFTQQSILFI